jgi:hypothetical protein
MIDVDAIRQRYEALSGCLDERGRRLFAAAEAKTAGSGGIAAVARVTGLAPSTIGRGLNRGGLRLRLAHGVAEEAAADEGDAEALACVEGDGGLTT